MADERVVYKGRKASADVTKAIPAAGVVRNDDERSPTVRGHLSKTFCYEIEFNKFINFFSIEAAKSKINAPKLYNYTNGLYKFSKKVINVASTREIVRKISLEDCTGRYLI